MRAKIAELNQFAFCSLTALLLLATYGCSSQSKTATVKKIPAGSEFSGYLSNYANLKPNPKFERTLSYVTEDPAKNIHRYVAIIVEPVAVYVATDADEKAIPERGRAALAEYFQQAITNAVADAFPIVQDKGPLVLRLRSAIIGVDSGVKISEEQRRLNPGEALERPISLGKVGIEVELVDSETGDQIASAVDRQNLGDGALIGSATFSREERFRAATDAFDGWAFRIREFLNAAHELSSEEIARVEATNQPYGADSDSK